MISTSSLFFRNYQRYLFVMFVFMLAIFFHYFTFPSEVSKSDKALKTESFVENPDLDAKHRERVYPRIFQSQAGDIFRMSTFIRTKDGESIEIFARSSLNEFFKIGEWSFAPSEYGEYKELVFSIPGRYEDVILRLKESEEGPDTVGDGSKVYIRLFSVIRLEVKKESEIKTLEPTFVGIPKIKKETLLSKKDADNSQDRISWVFQADGDFLQTIEFTGDIVGQGRQGYAFELTRFDQEKNGRDPKTLKQASFIIDALDDLLTSSGNYQLPFFVPLERGQRYVLSFTREPSNDRENFFNIGFLEPDVDADKSSAQGDIALHIRVRAQTKNGASFPDGAKLEDLGKSRLYSFSLEGEPVDYTNIFNASSSVRFDQAKHLVIGSQKNGEYLTYKFDTALPFDQFAIQATQKGNDEKEIKLEFSFDNAFWREIAFVQDKGGPQRFALALPGDLKMHVVYVRASYNGEDKKSGFFALETLSVNASIKKTTDN